MQLLENRGGGSVLEACETVALFVVVLAGVCFHPFPWLNEAQRWFISLVRPTIKHVLTGHEDSLCLAHEHINKHGYSIRSWERVGELNH